MYNKNITEYIKRSSLFNVLSTESIFSEDFDRKLSKLSEYLLEFLIVILVIYYLVKDTSNFSAYKSLADFLAPRIIGLVFISIGVLIFSKLLIFYLSTKFYFEKIAKNAYGKDELYTFSAGRILYQARKSDTLHGFLDSKIGRKIFLRLGIPATDRNALYISEKINVDENITIPSDTFLTVRDIANYLYSEIGFKQFLNERGITDTELYGAIDWVVYEIEAREYRRQWWRSEALGKIKGLADEWSFGQTFLLEKYSRNLLHDEEVNSEALVISGRDDEINQIENALSKSHESNAMLVGVPGQEKMQVIWGLSRNIKNKNTSDFLVGKKPILLSVSTISLTCRKKEIFEDQIIKIFNEVALAGNIILVIDNFGQLLSVAESLQTDLINLIDPYLASASVQIVALVHMSEYHQKIEPNMSLMNRFETVIVKPLSTDEIIKIISSSALVTEMRYRIVFTYQAILELANSAGYYFTSGVSYDKAAELLNEIAPWARRKKLFVISSDNVLEFIEAKTHIPLHTKISPLEQDILLHLETRLADRVIGQNDALLALADAIRRSRTGVRNPNKPIGSFLFLGPTGVGKTETAKALASIFFHSEENMMRLDMSEYQSIDAMERLIGSSDTNKPGILTNMLREKQYGVLLLDEFEKTNKDVLNLFLQILDEGIFSDMDGNKVSARNIIFIATSNAGADLIFSMIEKGQNPKDAQEEIVADIVGSGLFRPELINRFDGTIIFKPLEMDDLKKIAKIMLAKVATRMMAKGIKIGTSEELIQYIAENGSNKVFGARPMNRFIQDTIESKIASLMLENKAISGKTITFRIEGKTLLADVI